MCLEHSEPGRNKVGVMVVKTEFYFQWNLLEGSLGWVLSSVAEGYLSDTVS